MVGKVSLLQLKSYLAAVGSPYYCREKISSFEAFYRLSSVSKSFTV